MSTIHINEYSITELGKVLGVEPATLKSHLIAEGTEAPKETKISEVVAGLKVFKSTDYDTLIDNIGKEKYNAGRNASIGIPVEHAYKALFGEEKKFQFDRYEDAAAQIADIANKVAEKKMKEAGIEPDKKVQQLQIDIDTLRTNYSTKEAEVLEWKEKYTKLEQFGSVDAMVTNAVAAIPFASEKDVLQAQREATKTLFYTKYEIRNEDGKQWVVEKGSGKALKTATLEPVTVDEVVKGLAAIFPTKAAAAGRGDNSNSGNTISGLETMSEKDVMNEISAKGLNILSGEGRTLYESWVRAQSKKQ